MGDSDRHPSWRGPSSCLPYISQAVAVAIVNLSLKLGDASHLNAKHVPPYLSM